MHFLKIQTLAWLGCPSRLCLASEQWRCTFWGRCTFSGRCTFGEMNSSPRIVPHVT
jgi:hypothetical protein